MKAKTTVLLVGIVALIVGIGIGYMLAPSTLTPDQHSDDQIAILQDAIQVKEDEIVILQEQNTSLNQTAQSIGAQLEEKELEIVDLQQQIEILESQLEEIVDTEENDDSEKVDGTLILCPEAEGRLQITHEVVYDYRPVIEVRIKNIGAEKIVAKENETSGEYYDYFVFYIRAQDFYGRNISLRQYKDPFEFNLYDFSVGHIRTVYGGYDIADLFSGEEIIVRISIPSEDINSPAYTGEKVKRYEIKVGFED